MQYESDVAGMFCAVCKNVYASGDIVFVSRGCKDFKTSALARHASSKNHQSAIEKEKLAKTGSITTAVSHVVTANDVNESSLFHCKRKLGYVQTQCFDGVVEN